jgi:HK97 family phage portal protein
MWPLRSAVVDVALALTSDSHALERDATTDQAPPAIRPPRRSDTSTTVSVDRALSLATSYRCVSLLQTMVSGLDLFAVRGGKPMVTVPALLRRPSLDQPLRDTIAETVGALALHGNSYWLLVRGGPGEPVGSIVVLDPQTVDVQRDPVTGELIYKRLTTAGQWINYPAFQRAHLKLLRRPGALLGLGPVQAGQAELHGAIVLRDFASNWFETSSAVPKDGYLSTDQPLSKTEVDQYRNQLEQLHADGRIPVLGNGVKINLTHLTPQEALWIEAQSYYSATVARLFGVPTSLLDEKSGGSETYSNVQDRAATLITQTLSQYTAEIESAFTQLLAAGTSAKFDTSSLFSAVQGQASAKDNAVTTSTDTSTAPAAQPTGSPLA